MPIRLAGLGLIGIGALFAVLFVYFPIRDGDDGFMGPIRAKVIVFVPLAIVVGLAFMVGGLRVLHAFQARPKSKSQLTLVLSLLIVSGILSGVGYWQISSRWLRDPEPVILSVPPMPPSVPNMR